jgi:hypothetical protein
VSLGNIRPGGILLPYRKTPCWFRNICIGRCYLDYHFDGLKKEQIVPSYTAPLYGKRHCLYGMAYYIREQSFVAGGDSRLRLLRTMWTLEKKLLPVPLLSEQQQQ